MPRPTLGSLGTTAWEQDETGYSSGITISDGTSPFGTLTQSGLPNGLTASLSGSTITISGTPTVSGTFSNIQIGVTDNVGVVASNTYSLTIGAAPTLGTLGTTAWEQNETGYSSAVTISDGTGPFGTLTQSGLPAGLTASLSGTTITISGKPTISGTFSNIQLSVTDNVGVVASGTFSLTISPAPTLGTLGTTAWEQNETGYSSAITISDGTSPFGTLTQSGLPAGLTASLSGTTITISGTPTGAGAFSNIQISVTDANGVVASNTYSLTISPAPTLGTLGTTAWEQNETGYSSGITISDGTGPFGTLTQSGLPTGLTASLSGGTITISGKPTVSGTFSNIHLSVTDVNGVVASNTYSLTISPAPTLGTLGTTAWEQNETGYSSAAISISDGTGPFGTLTQSGLPAGLTASLSGSTITISGKPTASGTFNDVQLSVTDANGVVASGTYSLTITPAPTLGTLGTTAWEQNETGYSSAITISNGTGPFGTLTQSGLPAGLTASLSGSTITISGKPTASGTFSNLQLSVTDANGVVASGTYSLTISVAPTLGTLGTTAWEQNEAGYSSGIAISNGAGPFHGLTQSDLPAGLTASLSGSTITISGKPTAAGTFSNLQLGVTDAHGVVASRTYSLTINDTLTLGTLGTTVWTVNQAGYSSPITISNGTTPFHGLTQSGLPAGLTASLSGSTITISGTPTSTGAFSNVKLSVTDTHGVVASRTYSLTINAAPTLGALVTTAWAQNEAGYSSAITISNGTGPFHGLTQSGLPAGLTASLSGSTITISGTPTVSGTFSNVQLGVTDAVGVVASRTYSLTINAVSFPNISGTWYVNGKAASIAQSGPTLIFTNENRLKSTGAVTGTNSNTVHAGTWNLNGTLLWGTGTTVTEIDWSNGVIWTRAAAVPANISGTWVYNDKLTSITQNGASLVFTNENNQKSNGQIISSGAIPGHPLNVEATNWNNLIGTLSNSNTEIDWSNGAKWLKVPEISGAWTYFGPGPTNGLVASIIESGANLVFINEKGQKSNGEFSTLGTVIAFDWNNLVGTLTNGNTEIDWSNDTKWVLV